MHLTTVEAIRRASQGQALALAVPYSLRYDKNFSTNPHTKPRSLESISITPLSPEPAVHPQRNRDQKNANQP